MRRDPSVQLRISRTAGFHVKHAAFRNASSTVVFTGSANFTAKGLGGAGELVVEVSDEGATSGERDVFRRMWSGGFPDDQTDDVIEAYSKGWKPKWDLIKSAGERGRGLLKKFGATAKNLSAPVDDGSTLWFAVYGNFSDRTSRALQEEAHGVKNPDFLGLGSKGTFERIRRGTRRVWVLDLRGPPRDRTLGLHDIVREVEMPTEADGRYFAIISRAKASIDLKKERNRQALKELGLVTRVDSLACKQQTLRGGANTKASKLQAMSGPRPGT